MLVCNEVNFSATGLALAAWLALHGRLCLLGCFNKLTCFLAALLSFLVKIYGSYIDWLTVALRFVTVPELITEPTGSV